MQTNHNFTELLANASNQDFYCQQQLKHFIATAKNQAWFLIADVNELLQLAAVNDGLAAKLMEYPQVRCLLKDFGDLRQLAVFAPDTLAALLNHAEPRRLIKNFPQLLELLNKVEVLRVTLPPHAEIRALIQTPAQLEQLSQISISTHSNSNLAHLFISYADVRKLFGSFNQLVRFIELNPSATQLFIKDEHALELVKTAKQLNSLLKKIAKINPIWAKSAALKFACSTKIAKLFSRETDLMAYLNYLPDQESIQALLTRHTDLANLLQVSSVKPSSLLDMDILKAKKCRRDLPTVPFNLLQYA